MNTTKIVFRPVTIRPAASGFGLYDAIREDADTYLDPDDFMADPWFQEVYALGIDDLPEDVHDIRGLIHNEPDLVFFVRDHDGEPGYVGFDREETSC